MDASGTPSANHSLYIVNALEDRQCFQAAGDSSHSGLLRRARLRLEKNPFHFFKYFDYNINKDE